MSTYLVNSYFFKHTHIFWINIDLEWYQLTKKYLKTECFKIMYHLDMTKDHLDMTKDHLDMTKDHLDMTKDHLDMTKDHLDMTKDHIFFFVLKRVLHIMVFNKIDWEALIPTVKYGHKNIYRVNKFNSDIELLNEKVPEPEIVRFLEQKYSISYYPK
jgi:hypothetical protein